MDLADVASATDDAETADVTDVTDFAGGPDAPAVAEVGELANLSEVWNDEIGDVESTVIDEPAVEEPAEGAQPVNRGLLLKFLGSARS